MRGLGSRAASAFVVLGISALAGCGGPPAAGGAPGAGGSTLGNMILFAGPTVPPPMKQATGDVYCPRVDVADGGAALQSYAGGRTGDPAALRSQIAIGDLARECNGRPDGSTVVKVGVAGHVLLGAGGASGRYDVPVRIVVKRGSTVIATRTQRVAVAVPAGDTQAEFSVVEDGIVVPASDSQSFDIEVGLGGGGAAAPARHARRKRG